MAEVSVAAEVVAMASSVLVLVVTRLLDYYLPTPPVHGRHRAEHAQDPAPGAGGAAPLPPAAPDTP